MSAVAAPTMTVTMPEVASPLELDTTHQYHVVALLAADGVREAHYPSL